MQINEPADSSVAKWDSVKKAGLNHGMRSNRKLEKSNLIIMNYCSKFVVMSSPAAFDWFSLTKVSQGREITLRDALYEMLRAREYDQSVVKRLSR